MGFLMFLKDFYADELSLDVHVEFVPGGQFPVPVSRISEDMVACYLEHEHRRGLTSGSVQSTRSAIKDLWTRQREHYPAWFTAANAGTKSAMKAHRRAFAR
ncbi:hypothetical protein FVE85_8878 [Porphyridium purpureum]|uniref:Uncharacterized protein n=1 Tax=Porphyridium purpureum TaxID=35688 RepID=A0A5J4YRL8_PORPP|nr:hypothetical protein FVE85_8878 [Porphyridium purpureum]|eukprot:POR9667..scf296_7